jgi:hypothetical protein
MEGIVGTVFVLVLLVYFLTKRSDNAPKTKTTIKLNLQTPNTKNDSDPSSSAAGPSTYSNPTSNSQTSYQTTGAFFRSTEGFIPTDKCDCGGEWVKHVNKTTGGRFFGCSRFPSCENTRDKQHAKLYCSNGHTRTSQNTFYNSDGSRRCLVCRPLAEKPSRTSTPYSYAERLTRETESADDYCRNGHQRNDQNTYVRPNGERECRVCRKNAR